MRRRLSEAELENLPLPELSQRSDILQDFHLRTVSLCLFVCLRAWKFTITCNFPPERHSARPLLADCYCLLSVYIKILQVSFRLNVTLIEEEAIFLPFESVY